MQFVFEPGKLTDDELRDGLLAAIETMRREPDWRESVLVLKGLSPSDGLPARGGGPTGGGVRQALVEFVRDPVIKGAMATMSGLLLRGALGRIRARRGRAQ